MAKKTPTMVETFGLAEAQAGDEAVLADDDAADLRFSSVPWQDPGNLGPGADYMGDEEIVSKRLGRWILCAVIVQPMESFVASTGRGSPRRRGFMVDLEVSTHRTDIAGTVSNIIYHVERVVPDRAAAEALKRRMMDFIDVHTPRELLRLPRSGKNSMSAWRDGGPRNG